MTNAVICYCLFRVGLPLTLAVGLSFRFNAFSFIYALLLVILPLLPAPTSSAIKGHTGRFLKSIICLCSLICLSHLVFQASLIAFKPYGHFLEFCNDTEVLFRHVGLNRLDNASALDISRLIGVDFLVLIVSIVVFSQCKSYQKFFDARKLAAEKEKEEQLQQQQEEGSDKEDRSRRDDGSDFEDYQSAFDEERKRRRREKANALLHAIQDFSVVLFLAAAAIIHPSVISSLYFISFLAITTWWACYKKFGRAYAFYRIILLTYSGLHFIVLYLYQIPYAQKFLEPNSLFARIFGLNQLTYVDCSEPRSIHFEKLTWAVFLNPVFVFLLYWSLSAANRTWMLKPPAKKLIELNNPELHEQAVPEPPERRKSSRRPQGRKQSTQKLLETDFQMRKRNYKSIKRGSSARKRTETSMEVDPNGSIIWSSDTNPYGDGSTVTNNKFRQILTPVITLFAVITRQSYIATLIFMMAWGITYHSWLTFVLLLWSCILWMVPNSRKACLYGSPALVMYAIVLLIIQFIYGLDLSDEELPQQIESVNLSQIGLVKNRHLPVIPLSVKILFTVMFWITLRQYMQERYSEAHRDIGEGITAQPVAISFGTTRTGVKPEYQVSSPFIRKIGDFVMDLLTKYWIWVVAIMLMVISLEGDEDVVLYRVFYMALFLFFILMFQISYKWWRKTMYLFWLTVIVYSMLVLILIYTYQFEHFPHYWEEYIGISKKLQKDIGLRVYDTQTLFVKLLTPTFFLIITIIQLHYFHKDFLNISDIENYEKRKQDVEANVVDTESAHPESSKIIIEEEVGELSPSTSQAGNVAANPEHEKPPSNAETKDDKEKEKSETEQEAPKKEETLKDMLARWGQYLMENCYKAYDYGSNLIWRFLEVHMIKIVLFAVMALATYDVCAVHFLFVFFVVLSLPILRVRTILSHCCAIWASVLLLAKMIYQVSFVDKYGGWETNCTDVENVNASTENLPYPFNETVGNGNWMGFKKTTDLADYCKGYIGLILVLSIQAVVKIRQHIFRIKHDEPDSKPGVIFPEIARAQADLGLIECIQYFFNYLFYKFGIEFCFVTTVACIGVRLDVYSVISAIWLCALFLLRRRTLAKVWPFYVAFLCVCIPIQYIMAVGIPPGLCINYPWDRIMHPELRDWLYLPDFLYPPNSYKILVSFFEVLFACCQLHVFFIETAPNAELYEGGSNKEIYYESDTSNVIIDPKPPNPVPDFVTYTTSYLDLIKVVILFGFFWLTLAILFQAGTTRVSFFAMGYVIGCFLFLWNGNDFYVYPMKTIQRWWNFLLAYNVFVIFIKSILQVVGCVFLHAMYADLCWLVQLLGIACLKKLQRDNTLDMDVNVRFDDECKVPVDEAGLLWDGICFGFLLVQKRVFGSYYFQYLVTEIRAQQELASRGAELINDRLMKEVREQQAQEKQVVEAIKSKMDKIRAKQQKLRGTAAVDPETHFQAIRSGDYYMFDDLDDEVDLEIHQKVRQNASFDEDDEVDAKRKGLNALLSNTMKSNMKNAVEDTKSGDVSEVSSMQLSRQTSVASRPTISQKSSLKRFAPVPEQSRPTPPDSLPSLKPVHGDDYEMPPPDDIPPTASLSDVRPDLGEQEEEPPQSLASKIKTLIEFIKAFLESLIISLTAKLNAVSKDYRYVSHKLSAEKKILKEKYNQSIVGSHRSILPPTQESPEVKTAKESVKQSTSGDEVALISPDKTELELSKSGDDFNALPTPDSDQEKEFQSQRPPIVLFLYAVFYSILSRSEILCYIAIVINQINSASLLSLPLPLMAFMWGTLSVPRPTKTFWITIVTYTEAVVVIKYLFQFDFFPWNTSAIFNDPFFPPRILGIEKQKNYASFDLALLLFVFFHRFMLKSMGLWKDVSSSSTSSSPIKAEDGEDQKSIEDVKKPEEPESVIEHDAKNDRKINEDDEGDLTRIEEEEEEEEIDISEGEEKAKFNVKALMELPKMLLSGAYTYLTPFQQFFNQVLHPDFRVTVDVYFYMILCDLLLFIIVVFGYWAFGTNTGDQGVASYFEDNKIPVPFLVMLIAQFGLVVVDRALYLRKHILGKLIFQLVLVIFAHMCMFFILPAVTKNQFTSTLPPQLWYFTKCIYFLLSAYQIRCGYPTRILGNFLCKKYNILNLLLFKGFMFVPFLYELRALMDWMWTETSLSIGNWFKMEDIFANIFQLKCQRRFEEEYPSPRGAPKTPLVKYGIGGLLLFIIIGIIWFPLVLFALGNTVGVTNLPFDCTIQVAFGGYEPIFKMSAQQGSLGVMSKVMYEEMHGFYRSDRNALAFLASYSREDITVVELSGASTATWAVSPPSQEGIIKDLNGKYDMTITVTYQFSRESGSDADKTVINERLVTLPPNTELRRTLARMLNGTKTDRDQVKIPYLIPKLLKVPGKGKPTYIKALMKNEHAFSNLSISLHRGTFQNLTSESEWWEVEENCEETKNLFPFLSVKGCSNSTIRLIAFNDKVFPSELSILSGRGIVGLYTTIVLLLGRLFRSFIAGLSYTIMFDDMPNVDRVLQLCMDIYLVRESNELALEEDLFAKLIFLYRSPETLIKWTRYSESST